MLAAVVHTQKMRRALVLLLVLLVSCESVPGPAAPGESPTPTTAASPGASAAPQASRFDTLLYAEALGADAPTAVRSVSLTTGAIRTIASVLPKRDAQFALSPDERRLAIFEKEDMHEQRTARWRVRLVDVRDRTERELVPARVDPLQEVPWDIGWSSGGALLIAAPRRLTRIALGNGTLGTIRVFGGGTLGATFRDKSRPGLLVSQTVDTLSVHLLDPDGAGARLLFERKLVGITGYARRGESDDIVELATRFDGQVTLSLIHADGSEDARTLDGPRVDGLVELIGATSGAAYLLWPIAPDDPIALRTPGTAILYRVDLFGAVKVIDATRNFAPGAPSSLAPDGSALLVPIGRRPVRENLGTDYRFALAVCCSVRPAKPLLPAAPRDVIGWLSQD